MSVEADRPAAEAAAAAEPAEARLGTVRIAPNVLATVAALNALAVPGVARLVESPASMGRLMGRHEPGGVRVEVRDGAVTIDVHIAAKLGSHLVEVAEGVQQAVREAIPTLVGMPVQQVHVHVDDVE